MCVKTIGYLGCLFVQTNEKGNNKFVVNFASRLDKAFLCEIQYGCSFLYVVWLMPLEARVFLHLCCSLYVPVLNKHLYYDYITGCNLIYIFHFAIPDMRKQSTSIPKFLEIL